MRSTLFSTAGAVRILTSGHPSVAAANGDADQRSAIDQTGEPGAVGASGQAVEFGCVEIWQAHLELGVRNRFDPVENVREGADYLARQIVRLGDLRLALAA